MEEIEVSVEHAQEVITHHAEHAVVRWISGVALTSALLAVFAAVTALLAGHHANEGILDQMAASNTWAHFQSKSIKQAVLKSKIELLESLDKKASDTDRNKSIEYTHEQEELTREAHEKESESKHHMTLHEIFARGVTLFQVAIGIAAISVLTRRRNFWFFSMGFGIVGFIFMIQGLVS